MARIKVELFDKNLDLVKSEGDGKWRLWGKAPVEGYSSEWVCLGVYDRKRDFRKSDFDITIIPRPELPEEYR